MRFACFPALAPKAWVFFVFWLVHCVCFLFLLLFFSFALTVISTAATCFVNKKETHYYFFFSIRIQQSQLPLIFFHLITSLHPSLRTFLYFRFACDWCDMFPTNPRPVERKLETPPINQYREFNSHNEDQTDPNFSTTRLVWARDFLNYSGVLQILSSPTFGFPGTNPLADLDPRGHGFGPPNLSCQRNLSRILCSFRVRVRLRKGSKSAVTAAPEYFELTTINRMFRQFCFW